MPGHMERSIEELYAADPARADAVVFGRNAGPSRRGFLGGSGLLAMGAAVGGAIPYAANMPVGMIPAAFAQGGGSAPSGGAGVPVQAAARRRDRSR